MSEGLVEITIELDLGKREQPKVECDKEFEKCLEECKELKRGDMLGRPLTSANI